MHSGDCVYFKTCPPLLEIYNKRPATSQDRLFLSLSQCGFRDGQPLVCCRESAAVAPPPPPTAPPTQSPVVAQTDAPQQPRGVLPRPGECGIDAADRIYGGNRTIIDEYPWMVLLQYSKRELRTFLVKIKITKRLAIYSKQQKRIPLRRSSDSQPIRFNRLIDIHIHLHAAMFY